MRKNAESTRKALRARVTLKDIEKIARKADKAEKRLKKQIGLRMRDIITEWENNEERNFPVEEFMDLHSELCSQSIDMISKSYEECKALTKT